MVAVLEMQARSRGREPNANPGFVTRRPNYARGNDRHCLSTLEMVVGFKFFSKVAVVPYAQAGGAWALNDLPSVPPKQVKGALFVLSAARGLRPISSGKPK